MIQIYIVFFSEVHKSFEHSLNKIFIIIKHEMNQLQNQYQILLGNLKLNKY